MVATWCLLTGQLRPFSDPTQTLTKRTGLVRIDMASFQPSRTMATMAHRGGSLLLAALLASCVFTACTPIEQLSKGAWRHMEGVRRGDRQSRMLVSLMP